MRFVVGYTSTPSGRDALALGTRLAVAHGAKLDLVVVLGSADRATLAPSDPGYDRILRERAEAWLAEAAATVASSAPGVAVRRHTVYAESFAEGLSAAAVDLGAAAIVIGAARGGLLGRFTIGSTANSLLHSSPVPVALAPEGTAGAEPATASVAPITRITCAVGTLAGADHLVDVAIDAASTAAVPLRFLSLVPLDLPELTADAAAALDPAAAALAEVSDAFTERVEVETLVASGSTVGEAVTTVDWRPGELVYVGASRLAARGRLFLGSTAAKMLRELPVPMIVVPREPADEPASAEKGGAR